MNIEEIPVRTYPRGEAAYYKEYEAFGDRSPFTLLFWWREMWHFIGGMLIALPLCWLYPMNVWAVPFFVYGGALAKEWYHDRILLDRETLGFKEWADIWAWVLGSFFLGVLITLMGYSYAI